MSSRQTGSVNARTMQPSVFSPPTLDGTASVTIVNRVVLPSDPDAASPTDLKYNLSGSSLTIQVLVGVTTAQDVVDFFSNTVEAATGWRASLGEADGDGILLAGPVTLAGGTLGSPASLEISLPGSTDTLVLRDVEGSTALSGINFVVNAVPDSGFSRFTGDRMYASADWEL